MQTKDLLDCSQDVLRAEKALEVQYEEYYEQLADQQSLSPEEQAALRSDVTREVEMLESESASDGFWDNLEKAQKVQQRVKQLRDKIGGAGELPAQGPLPPCPRQLRYRPGGGAGG